MGGLPGGDREYAARSCPVSALEGIELTAGAGARIVHDARIPTQVGCDRPAPPVVARDRVITVRPDRRYRDCVNDFAVTMYLDASGAIATVNVVLSSP